MTGHMEDENEYINVIESKSKKGVVRGKKGNSFFDDFWKIYPKKVARQSAEKAWSKLSVANELFEQIVESLEKWKRSDQWVKDGGQFIPNAATWLNGERWNDEVPEPVATKPNRLTGQTITERMRDL